MLRLIAVAVAGLALTASAQALTPAPLLQPDGMITQVRFGWGPSRTRVAGVCVARTTIRHTRRAYRRGYWGVPAHGFAKCRSGEPLRLVTLAAGVIDEPLPAAARLSRRTLPVVIATSNE